MRMPRLFAGIIERFANDRPRSHLAHRVIILATGSVLLTGTAARADDFLLATGGVFGGVTQNLAVCYAFNAGTIPVIISSMVIRDQNGKVTGKTGCVGKLEPAKICSVVSSVSTTLAYSCTISGTASIAADLRGVMDIRDASRNVLINSNLH